MQKKRKEKRRDSRVWKRFLDTIIQQLPSYIARYPPSDQALLNGFFTILKEYNVDIVTNREKLFDQLRISSQSYRDNERYLQLPFLWFVVDYFENASRLLNVTDFYADNFYEYLVSSLRGDSQTLGAYQLLRDTIPLDEQHWEELQYTCNSPSPLNDNEMKALEIVYSLASHARIEVLDSDKLRKVISSNVPTYNTFKSVSKFFTSLNCLWSIQYNLAAFDLYQIYFFIKFEDSCSLSELIDFQNERNTILRSSDVYRIPDVPNAYTGILVIPKIFFAHMYSLIQYFKDQGCIRSFKLEKITDIRISNSLVQYQSNKGWQATSNSRWGQILKQLTSSQPRKTKKPIKSFYLLSSLNYQWHYQMHDAPTKIIRLFCKTTHNFAFENLPYNLSDEKNLLNFSKDELIFLRTLYGSKIAFLLFFPSRLISDFSLDRYWIKIPKIPLFQLQRFLMLVPFAQIIFHKSGSYIWTVLSNNLKKRIEKDLKWEVIPIIRVHQAKAFSEKWFDFETLKWRTPLVLEKRKDEN